MFSGFGDGHQFVEGVAAALEQFLRVRGIPGDGDLITGGFVHPRRGQLHGGLEAAQCNARPGNIHVIGILDGDRADHARALERHPALRG